MRKRAFTPKAFQLADWITQDLEFQRFLEKRYIDPIARNERCIVGCKYMQIELCSVTFNIPHADNAINPERRKL